MGLSAPLLAYGLGVILLAVIAALYRCSLYDSGETQVRKNLAHRERMRTRKLARDRQPISSLRS